MNKLSIEKKIKLGFILSYCLILVGGFFFVKNALAVSGISVETKEKENKDIQDVKPIDVELVVKNGKKTNRYKKEMENNQSVLDLIERARFDDAAFTFEKNAYTYGTKIVSVNGTYDTENFEWRITIETVEKDVLDQAKNLDLDKEDFDLLYSAINNPVDITLEIGDVSLPANSTITLEYKEVK